METSTLAIVLLCVVLAASIVVNVYLSMTKQAEIDNGIALEKDRDEWEGLAYTRHDRLNEARRQIKEIEENYENEVIELREKLSKFDRKRDAKGRIIGR